MENWIEDVIIKWKSEGVKVNPPATLAEIEFAEAIVNFEFPLDFKAFYLKINGFEDCEWQEHMFSFWSLKRILEEWSDRNNTNFIGFCDFLISSHEIGFDIISRCIIIDYSIEGEIVSNSFKETIELINSSDPSVY